MWLILLCCAVLGCAWLFYYEYHTIFIQHIASHTTSHQKDVRCEEVRRDRDRGRSEERRRVGERKEEERGKKRRE